MEIINKTKVKKKDVKIKELFNSLDITKSQFNTFRPDDIYLKIKTPYGFYDINKLFFTEKHNKTCTVYFKNGKTLKCSYEHRIMCNNKWTKIKNIDVNKHNIIDTKDGLTDIKYIRQNNKNEILYDMSVKDVHSYYANNIYSHNSWTLCHLTFRMMLDDYKVVFYNLERGNEYIAMRIDSILTGINTQKLEYNQKEVREKIKKKINGNVFIKDFPSQVTTINRFKAHYENLLKNDFEPDVIVVDYGDIIGSIRTRSQDWLDQKQKFDELKSFAQQIDKPVWTASQAGKQAVDKDIVETKDMQRSYSKVAPCDLILGWSRKAQDKINNTARLHIAKNTFGPDGKTFPCRFNPSDGKMNVYSDDSKMGEKIKNKMKEEDGLTQSSKKRLKDKFNENF